MNDVSTVNSQLLDSVSDVVTLLTGQAPSQAFALLDAVMVETLGMAMHNAVNRQQGASMVSSAAVTAACAKMLAVPIPLPPAPTPPAPTPPTVTPLPSPPPDLSPNALVAAAFTQAETAIDALKAQASGASDVAKTAQTDLSTLITDAGGTAPATPSTTPGSTTTPDSTTTTTTTGTETDTGGG